MTHYMVDIETLGRKPGCVVTEVALVRFAKYGRDVLLHEYLEVEPQLKRGLKIEGATVDWWLKQGRPAASKPALYPSVALLKMNEFFHGNDDDRVWAKSPGFDCAILGALAQSMSVPLPWKYFQERDVRTIIDYAPRIEFAGEKHNALHDAEHQVKQVQAAWENISNA